MQGTFLSEKLFTIVEFGKISKICLLELADSVNFAVIVKNKNK